MKRLYSHWKWKYNKQTIELNANAYTYTSKIMENHNVLSRELYLAVLFGFIYMRKRSFFFFLFVIVVDSPTEWKQQKKYVIHGISLRNCAWISFEFICNCMIVFRKIVFMFVDLPFYLHDFHWNSYTYKIHILYCIFISIFVRIFIK